MYIRWKQKRLKGSRTRPPDDSLSAVLVKAVYIDGKPRQRFVKHLGSIHAKWIDAPGHQTDFWQTADRALAALGLPDAERERLETRLAERVPRPTPEVWAWGWPWVAEIGHER